MSTVTRFLCLIVVSLLPLMAARAHAADSPEYSKLLQDGVQEFGLGNYGEARLLFSRAHAISPTARTFRGLGLCDYEQRHYVNAIAELEAALTDTRRPLTPELREQVEPVLERAKQFVGRYQLRVPLGVTRLTLDGTSQPLPAHGELLLDPGPHRIEIEPEDLTPVVRELTVEVGARQELSLLPAPPPAEPVVAQTPEPELQPLAAPVAPPAEAQPRVFTWVAVGLTGVFGAGILGFGLGAKSKNTTFRQQADMGLVPDAQLKSSGQTFETLTNVSIVGCALSAAAAVTLFIVEGKRGEPDAPPTEPGVQAGISPAGAYVQGRF
jgi:hypothetical protein